MRRSNVALRLQTSLLEEAKRVAESEGVALNQLINVAVAEKLVHLQHEEWLASRPKPTAARIARALAILDHSSQNAPDPGDELPDGYVSIRDTDEYKQALGAK